MNADIKSRSSIEYDYNMPLSKENGYFVVHKVRVKQSKVFFSGKSCDYGHDFIVFVPNNPLLVPNSKHGETK